MKTIFQTRSPMFPAPYFQGQSPNEPDIEALEQELQGLLTQLPQDEYTPSSQKIDFKFQDPTTVEKPANSPAFPQATPGSFQPLSAEAAACIPRIQATEASQDLGKTLADQLQTLIKQGISISNRPKQMSSTDSSQRFQDQRLQRQAEEKKEIEKDHQQARQKIVQLGLNTAGLATFGIVAGSAFAVAAPVGGMAAGATALLAMSKISAASALLGFASNLFNTATELIGNKQSTKAVKSLISDFWGGFGKAFSFGKRLLGFKQNQAALKFGGSEQVQPQQSKINDSTNQLEAQYKQATERFYTDIDKTTSEFEKNQVTQTLQKTLLTTTQTFLLENGTEEEKKKIRQIQKFQTNFEILSNAFTPSQQRYTDLSEPAQNHLRQMIFDTLTSDVPELQEWGKKQGRAIGMTIEQVNKVLYRTR